MNKTAFIFDDVRVTPDRQIGLHSHQVWELSMVVCGAGKRTVGDHSESITEGEIILIPPQIPHVWEFEPSHTDAEGCIANISVFFESDVLEGLSKIIPELRAQLERLMTLTDAVSLQGESRCKVCDLLDSMRVMTPAARVPGMIDLLRLIADADLSNSVGHPIALSRTEQRLDKVRTFCSCNFGRDICLEEVASYIGMNKSSFCSFMRRHTGKSFSEYLNNMRLDRAMDMLRNTDRNVSDIAYDTGFSNVTYFNRLFRLKYNCTPTSIRQNSNTVL